MKTANSIGGVLIRRDNPFTDANQIRNRQNDKERIYFSKRENDNQAHYVPNSIN